MLFLLVQKQQLHKTKFDDIFERRESQSIEMKNMRMTRENDRMPDLKLGLSPGSVEDDTNVKNGPEADQEVDSVLSLSLSPLNPSPKTRKSQVHSFNILKETEKPSLIKFLEPGSSDRAALGLSTLDLTMSIKALE